MDVSACRPWQGRPKARQDGRGKHTHRQGRARTDGARNDGYGEGFEGERRATDVAHREDVDGELDTAGEAPGRRVDGDDRRGRRRPASASALPGAWPQLDQGGRGRLAPASGGARAEGARPERQGLGPCTARVAKATEQGSARAGTGEAERTERREA